MSERERNRRDRRRRDAGRLIDLEKVNPNWRQDADRLIATLNAEIPTSPAPLTRCVLKPCTEKVGFEFQAVFPDETTSWLVDLLGVRIRSCKTHVAQVMAYAGAVRDVPEKIRAMPLARLYVTDMTDTTTPAAGDDEQPALISDQLGTDTADTAAHATAPDPDPAEVTDPSDPSYVEPDPGAVAHDAGEDSA